MFIKLALRILWTLAILLGTAIFSRTAYAQVLQRETASGQEKISQNQTLGQSQADEQVLSQKAQDLLLPDSLDERDRFEILNLSPQNLIISKNVLEKIVPENSVPAQWLSQSSDRTLPENNPSPIVIPVEFGLSSISLEPVPQFPNPLDKSEQLLSTFPENIDLEQIRFSAEAAEQLLKSNAKYKIIPQIVDKTQLPSFFSAIPLNGSPINHLSEWQVSAGYQFGEGLSRSIVINGLYALKSNIKQSLTQDNVFIVDQSGFYLKLQSVTDQRRLTLTRVDPQTTQGLEYRFTFTGSCAAAGRFDVTDPAAQCSLTPALATDRNSINPTTLQATQIAQIGNFGEVLSPETLDILAQPGFQSEGANGQKVGLDLFFPNTGTTDGNSQTNQSSISRFDDTRNTYTLGLYRVRQVYASNYEKAVLGRTIHGFTGILQDRNFPVNFGVQALSQFLPDVFPHLKGDKQKPANTALNENLIFSANNTRFPDNSFVVYQAGYGESKHPQLNQVHGSSAMFNSLWLGISPVAERQSTTSSSYIVTSPARIISATAVEGGPNTGVPISVLSLLNFNNTITGILSSNLSDYYTQVYLTFFQNDVNRITTTELTEKFNYYPHLSFTGNITQYNKVFRYYAGVITSPQPKAYLGADFSYDFLKGVRWSTSLIGYINADRDHFSKAESRLEKTFRFNRSTNLTIFGNFRYVFDQVADPGNGFYTNPVDNFLAFGATAKIGPVTAGVTQYVDALPAAVPTTTGYSLGIDLAGHGSLSGYLSPQRGVINYGVLTLLKLNSTPNAPSLSLSWNRAVIDFGKDSFDNNLGATEDRFLILFRMGAPANPFVANPR